MHEIDEKSPLRAVDWSKPGDHLMMIAATMLGHDGTYGQTVHARHLYRPDELRVDQRFVDVLSQLEDGRMMIDYERFHDTVPDVAPPQKASSEEVATEPSETAS